MLTLEAVSVGSILFLAAQIVTKVPLSTTPLRPHGLHGWAGVGYSMVFAVLSFGALQIFLLHRKSIHKTLEPG
jgi:hypothetical protein